MDNSNTNKPGPEADNLLPLDFEEAARMMSGNETQEEVVQPVPDEGEMIAAAAMEAFEDIQAPETVAPEVREYMATPEELSAVQVSPPPSSPGFSDRKPGKTLADELSKSKSPLIISFGSSLRDMRERRGISLNEVADQTKIRKDYLEALENEDFRRLPPAVFVCGYVRKICDLYEVPREVNDDIIRQLKEHADYGLGEEGIEQIIEPDTESNFEAEKRIRHKLFVIGAVLVVLVGAVLIIVLLSLSGREKAPLPSDIGAPKVITVYDPESLKDLNPPKVIKMSELPLPEN